MWTDLDEEERRSAKNQKVKPHHLTRERVEGRGDIGEFI